MKKYRIQSWSPDDLSAWLYQFKRGKYSTYAAKFLDSKLDGKFLVSSTQAELDGILHEFVLEKDRYPLLKAIAKLVSGSLASTEGLEGKGSEESSDGVVRMQPLDLEAAGIRCWPGEEASIVLPGVDSSCSDADEEYPDAEAELAIEPIVVSLGQDSPQHQPGTTPRRSSADSTFSTPPAPPPEVIAAINSLNASPSKSSKFRYREAEGIPSIAQRIIQRTKNRRTSKIVEDKTQSMGWDMGRPQRARTLPSTPTTPTFPLNFHYQDPQRAFAMTNDILAGMKQRFSVSTEFEHLQKKIAYMESELRKYHRLRLQFLQTQNENVYLNAKVKQMESVNADLGLARERVAELEQHAKKLDFKCTRLTHENKTTERERARQSETQEAQAKIVRDARKSLRKSEEQRKELTSRVQDMAEELTDCKMKVEELEALVPNRLREDGAMQVLENQVKLLTASAEELRKENQYLEIQKMRSVNAVKKDLYEKEAALDRNRDRVRELESVNFKIREDAADVAGRLMRAEGAKGVLQDQLNDARAKLMAVQASAETVKRLQQVLKARLKAEIAAKRKVETKLAKAKRKPAKVGVTDVVVAGVKVNLVMKAKILRGINSYDSDSSLADMMEQEQQKAENYTLSLLKEFDDDPIQSLIESDNDKGEQAGEQLQARDPNGPPSTPTSDDILKLRTARATLTAKLGQMKLQVAAWQERFGELQNKYMLQSAEVMQLKDTLKQNQGGVSDDALRNALRKENLKLLELQRRNDKDLTELRTQVVKLRDHNQLERQKWLAESAEMVDKLGKLQATRSTLEQEVGYYKRKTESLQKELGQLVKNQAQETTESAKQLERRLQEALSEAREWREQSQDVQDEAKEWKTKEGQARVDLKELREKNSELQRELAQLQGKCTAMGQQLTSNQEEQESLRDVNRTVLAKSEVTEEQVGDYKKQLEQAMSRIQDLAAERESLSHGMAKLEGCKTQLAIHKDQSVKLRQEVQSHMQVNMSLTGRVEQLQAKLAQVQSEAETQRRRLMQQQTISINARQQLDRTRQMMGSRNKDIHFWQQQSHQWQGKERRANVLRQEAEMRIIQIHERHLGAHKEIEGWKTKLEDMLRKTDKENKVLKATMTSLRDEMTSKNERISMLEQEVSGKDLPQLSEEHKVMIAKHAKLQVQIEQLEKQRSSNEKLVRKLNDSKEDLQSFLDRYEVLETQQRGLEGINKQLAAQCDDLRKDLKEQSERLREQNESLQSDLATAKNLTPRSLFEHLTEGIVQSIPIEGLSKAHRLIAKALGVARQDEEKRENDVKNHCCVCMEKPRTHIILPCNHFIMCEGCSTKLKTCPLCSRDISEIRPVYD